MQDPSIPLVYLSFPQDGYEHVVQAYQCFLQWAQAKLGPHISTVQASSINEREPDDVDEEELIRRGGLVGMEAILDHYAAILTVGAEMSAMMAHEVAYMQKLGRPHYDLVGKNLDGVDALMVMTILYELVEFGHPSLHVVTTSTSAITIDNGPMERRHQLHELVASVSMVVVNEPDTIDWPTLIGYRGHLLQKQHDGSLSTAGVKLLEAIDAYIEESS